MTRQRDSIRRSVRSLANGCIVGSVSLMALVPSATAETPTASPSQCARRTPTTVTKNPWSAARKHVAPAGPAAIRLCRYSGVNAHPHFTLARSTLVRSSRTIGQLVRRFDEIPPPSPASSCGFDDGSVAVAHLAYRKHHSVTIRVALGGCHVTTNGDLKREALGPVGTELVKQLERLTGGKDG